MLPIPGQILYFESSIIHPSALLSFQLVYDASL